MPDGGSIPEVPQSQYVNRPNFTTEVRDGEEVQVMTVVGMRLPEAKKSTANIDMNKVLEKLKEMAGQKFNGKCATHVRIALSAGGADMTTRPRYAKDYGNKLLTLGLSSISTEGYVAQIGDVAVFDTYKGQNPQAGHIQIYDGENWVSDIVQPRFLPHRTHYKDSDYAIYRQ